MNFAWLLKSCAVFEILLSSSYNLSLFCLDIERSIGSGNRERIP